MSFGLPCGAPASTHFRMVSICLSLSERSFLKLCTPTRLVDVPGRHLVIGDARADRARPRPRLCVGDERHRRDRIGPVARLALVLEDRRDVLREGRRRRRRGLRAARADASASSATDHDRADEHRPHATHMSEHKYPSTSLHGHLDVGIGPATLKTAAAFTRFVVGLHAQQVVARRRERGRARSPSRRALAPAMRAARR